MGYNGFLVRLECGTRRRQCAGRGLDKVRGKCVETARPQEFFLGKVAIITLAIRV